MPPLLEQPIELCDIVDRDIAYSHKLRTDYRSNRKITSKSMSLVKKNKEVLLGFEHTLTNTLLAIATIGASFKG